MNIQSIWMKVRLGQYVVSFSHTEKIRLRMISLEEIETAILSGTIIEPYSDDFRGPSCLIFGLSRELRPLHVVCGNLEDDELLVITAYEPDLTQWESDFITRKKEV
ncbi:MAG: DUF4258 domain-containing protein [Deltaproteobacteria bacterium]